MKKYLLILLFIPFLGFSDFLKEGSSTNTWHGDIQSNYIDVYGVNSNFYTSDNENIISYFFPVLRFNVKKPTKTPKFLFGYQSLFAPRAIFKDKVYVIRVDQQNIRVRAIALTKQHRPVEDDYIYSIKFTTVSKKADKFIFNLLDSGVKSFKIDISSIANENSKNKTLTFSNKHFQKVVDIVYNKSDAINLKNAVINKKPL